MGGGPSKEQKAAATAQTNLDNQLANVFNKQFDFQQMQQGKANPFYTSEMDKGLPYLDQALDLQAGTTARAFQTAKSQLEQRLGQQANALPSGFAEQARADLGAQQSRAYDQNLQNLLGANFQARQAGASGLLGQAQIANPAQYSGQAIQGNASIMNAPLARPGIGGLLGGIGGGLASALPF